MIEFKFVADNEAQLITDEMFDKEPYEQEDMLCEIITIVSLVTQMPYILTVTDVDCEKHYIYIYGRLSASELDKLMEDNDFTAGCQAWSADMLIAKAIMNGVEQCADSRISSKIVRAYEDFMIEKNNEIRKPRIFSFTNLDDASEFVFRMNSLGVKVLFGSEKEIYYAAIFVESLQSLEYYAYLGIEMNGLLVSGDLTPRLMEHVFKK